MPQYIAASNRTLADIMNRKALSVLIQAFKFTPKATLANVHAATGYGGLAYDVVGQNVRFLKSGKVKIGKAIVEKRTIANTPLVYRILNARRRRAGEKPLNGAEMRAAVNAFFARRINAIGSLRAGWVDAINYFRAVTGAAASIGASPRVKQKSSGRAAKPGWNPGAQFTWRLNVRKGAGRMRPWTIPVQAVQALQKAFNAEARSMADYVAGRMQATANQFTAPASRVMGGNLGVLQRAIASRNAVVLPMPSNVSQGEFIR